MMGTGLMWEGEDRGERVGHLQPLGKIIFEIGVEKKRKEGGGGEKRRKEGREGRRKGNKKGKGKEKRWNELYNIKELPVILGGKYSESCGNHSITHEMFFNKYSF